MRRNLFCLGLIVGIAAVIGVACGDDDKTATGTRPDLREALAGGKADLASRFDTLPAWLKHQPYEELSCQGPPVLNRFVDSDSGHSYSFPAEQGVSYTVRFEGSHERDAGIVAGVYDAADGKVLVIDGDRAENSIKLQFDSPLTGKVIVAVFSAWDATGDYNLSIYCDGSGPVFCSDDDGCTDGFCDCVDTGCTGKICKPWGQWGDSCGGFVLPQYRVRCHPELRCAGGNMAIDMPGNCTKPATVDEILADLDTFEDKPVFVNGFIQNVGQYCSKMMCTTENPCCNYCGAEQRLFDEEVSGARPEGGLGLRDVNAEESYGCHGNNCDFLDNCTVEDIDIYQFGVVGKVRRIRAMDAPISYNYIDVEYLSPFVIQ
jgi:hypothetical protein